MLMRTASNLAVNIGASVWFASCNTEIKVNSA